MTMINLLGILGIADAYAADATNAAVAATTAAATTTATTPSTGQGLLSMLPMLIILVLFMYFMVIRPQSKRAKEHRNLLSGLQVGDEIVIAGGILGRIEKISDNFIVLNIAENTNISVQKNSILSCVPKGTMKSV